MSDQNTHTQLGAMATYLKNFYRDKMPDAYKFRDFKYLHAVLEQVIK